MGAFTANLRFLNGYANSSTGTFPDWFDATGITGFSLDNENALSTAIPDADAFFSTADLNIVSDGQVEWSQGSTLVTLSGSGVEGLSNLEPENISAALDEGVTNRQLTNFSVAYDDEELARFEVTSTGVTITTGDQSANLIGAAPNGLGALGETFDVFERFSGLFSEYDDERGSALAFFDQQNLSGLLIKNGEEEVLNASLSDRSFSMSAGGATFELDGVDLPNTSLGSMMDAGVRVIADNLRDDFGGLNLSMFAGMDITSLGEMTLTVGQDEYASLIGPITDFDTPMLDGVTVNTQPITEGDSWFSLSPNDRELVEGADIVVNGDVDSVGLDLGVAIADADGIASLDSYFKSFTFNPSEDAHNYLNFGFSDPYGYGGWFDINQSLDYSNITTDINLATGAFSITDETSDLAVDFSIPGLEWMGLTIAGALNVTGTDDHNSVSLDYLPTTFALDLGADVDELNLQDARRVAPDGFTGDASWGYWGYTKEELLNEVTLHQDGDQVEISAAGQPVSEAFGTLSGVEYIRLAEERDADTPNFTGGSQPYSINQLIAEQNASDGVATIGGTQGDDDLGYVNLSEPNDDVQQLIIDAGAGEDEVGLRLTEAMISNPTAVSFQGGADYDTLKVKEYDHGQEEYEIEVDFGAGEITYTNAKEASYTAEFADFERVRVLTESDLFAYGSDSDDVLRYDGYGEFQFIDDSTTDTDRLELHRLRTEAGNGLTLDELFELVSLSRADDGSVVFTSNTDGSIRATLKNIEYIRLMTGRDADETRDYSVQELLDEPPVPIEDKLLEGTDGNDDLQGLAGNDTLIGFEGDDTLRGGFGDDRLEPGTGNDRAYGQDGNDTIIGVDSDISAIGGSGDDLIDFSGITTGYGGWAEPGLGQNTVIGSQIVWDAGEGGGLSYADVEDEGGVVLRVAQDGSGTVTSATAGLVNDTFSYMTNFFGSQGADVFTGSDNRRENGNWEGWNGLGGDDTIDGGQGFDELKYNADRWWANTLGAVTVNFATGKATDGFGDEDTFSNIEAVRGTHLGDTFIGSDDQSYIRYRGLAGDDTITGTAGTYDILDHRRDRNERDADENHSGDNGIIANFVEGTVIDGFGDTDSVSFIDEIRGTIFGDHITAGDDGLVMAGYIGDDTLIGGAGDDDFYVGDGSSSADGDDWLYLNRVIADVRVNGVDITDDEAVSAAAFTRDDVLTVTSTDGNLSVTAEGIEALVFQDTFVDLDVLLSGATSAADEVGDATATVSQDLSAGGGDDTVLGGQADDDLNGGEGNDDIDAGDDFVFDNTGDTTVEGGAGDDIVVAIGGNGNFTDTGEVTVVANEVNDFFCGGVWDDWFDAGSGNDILVGDIGSDRHYGNDTLNGGADNYLLQGGWGQDVFIFGNNDGEDTIARIDLDRIDFGNIGNVPLTGPDFQSGVDKIHLESAGFADLSGDSALAFAKVSDVTVDGVTFAQFDHNGTKINFHGLTLSDLSASDFDFV